MIASRTKTLDRRKLHPRVRSGCEALATSTVQRTESIARDLVSRIGTIPCCRHQMPIRLVGYYSRRTELDGGAVNVWRSGTRAEMVGIADSSGPVEKFPSRVPLTFNELSTAGS